MFRRYAITDTKGIANAIAKREQVRTENSREPSSALPGEAKFVSAQVKLKRIG